MKYAVKVKQEDSHATLEFVGRDGNPRSLHLGSIREGALAERCLVALYDHHQVDDSFDDDAEIAVEGVGNFKVVEKIHVDVADEATHRAVIGVTDEQPYRISYDGMDGNKSTLFATIDEATTYVKERWMGIDYMDSRTGFHTDYGRYQLFGFDLNTIGKVHGKGDERDYIFQVDCPHSQTINAVCLKCGKKLF